MGWNETDLSYAAGIVDGEGCLMAERSKRQRKSGNCHINYVPTVKVAMTDQVVIGWLYNLFGGDTGIIQPHIKNYKIQYTWRIRCKPAIEFIKIIKPYLKAKKLQAEVFVAFEKTLTNNRPSTGRWGAELLDPNVQSQKEKLYNLLKNLHKENNNDVRLDI